MEIPKPNDNEDNTCRCCGYVTDLKEYDAPFMSESYKQGEKIKYCEICASTFLSHSISYPSLYGDQHHLWASLGWIANMLRDEIRNIGKQ